MEHIEKMNQIDFAESISGMRKPLQQIETWAISIILGTMVLLPILEVILRFFHHGIEGASSILLHLTLATASIGGAIAATQDRLLAFTLIKLVGDRAAQFAKLVSHSLSAGISALLCIASIQFIQAEYESATIIAYGIPSWIFILVQPVGFGLITWRLLRHAANTLSGFMIATLVATLLSALVLFEPVDPEYLFVPILLCLGIAVLLGAPIFVAVGGSALILLWGDYVPLASIAVDFYGIATNPSLPAIPLFTLAGYFLAESSAPQRLVLVFNALFGRIRGGAAIAVVLAATFFTCFTGASGVTILALGGLAMPMLLNAGMSKRNSLGLITAGGSAGVLLMPALPLVLYAIVARVEIEAMFVAGIIPAILMVIMVGAWGIYTQPGKSVGPLDRQKVRSALWQARWELITPLIPIGFLFTGLATPVESAALTALYTFILVTVIHKDLHIVKDIPRIFAECGLVVGGILLILGVALGLTNYMVDAQVTVWLINKITQSIESPLYFLLALNLFLLVVGCFMDIFSAIIVLVPLIIPLGQAFGINPLHLGLIFLANLELGYLTPPLGMNLFYSALRFDKPVLEVCFSSIPIFLILLFGVVCITYIPELSIWLPGILLK